MRFEVLIRSYKPSLIKVWRLTYNEHNSDNLHVFSEFSAAVRVPNLRISRNIMFWGRTTESEQTRSGQGTLGSRRSNIDSDRLCSALLARHCEFLTEDGYSKMEGWYEIGIVGTKPQQRETTIDKVEAYDTPCSVPRSRAAA